MPDDKVPVLTAVVFGYRNEATILRAVGSLVEQPCAEPFEVVVATSGGDRTAEVIRAEFPEVRVAESPTRLFPGGVRNLGITMARGQIIAFLEADCVARPGWVENRIALHRAGHQSVASALANNPGDGPAGRAWLYLVHSARLTGHEPGPTARYQAYGLSFTRELLDRAGPFDEMLRTDEDTLMAERLDNLGVESWFDPSVCIEHVGPPNVAALLRDQYSRGRLGSWQEILVEPPGRLRQRWERVPWARGVFIFLRSFSRLGQRVRWLAVLIRAGRPGSFGDLLVAATPMALGQAAYQIGWITDQVRACRSPQGTPRGELPRLAGLRRRVATTGESVVALTFSDGPSEQTDAILHVLDGLEIPATFFVTGVAARARPDVVRRIAAAGHVVGSSGWSGRPFTSLPVGDLEREVTEANALLEQLIGAPIRHVRPPAGFYDWRVVAALHDLGLGTWLWTSHPETASPVSGAEEILSTTLDGLTPGSVLLLQEGDRSENHTLEALPALIKRSLDRGYRFVSLD
jgi:peptidoglycan/xylan/chitin deacetylase (PgdA/CDA1 family)/GT2 family glycosyltransferase